MNKFPFGCGDCAAVSFKPLLLLVGMLLSPISFVHSQALPELSSSASDSTVTGKVETTEDGGYFFSVTGDEMESLHGQLVTFGFENLSQFQVSRRAGMGGVLMMSDAGVEGAVLAVLWGKNESLSVVYRSGTGEPLQVFALNEASKAGLSLVKRDGMIYAYAADADGSTPLVAVDFDFGKAPSVGVIAADGFTCSAPQLTPVAATLSLTADLDFNKVGTTLLGEWKKETFDSTSSEHLVNDGNSTEAAGIVQINGLLAGSHDLWIRYSADSGRTTDARVQVDGFGAANSLSLNQQIAGGVWLPLGRYVVEKSANASITIKPGKAGTGSLSADAIHYLWAEWKDDDHNGIPDAWELLNGSNSKALAIWRAATHIGTVSSERYEGDVSEDIAAAAPLSTAATNRSVLFVNLTGDDANDGLSRRSVSGPWQGIKAGPKRTVRAALDAASGAKVVELHVDGSVQPPEGGFQNLGDVAVILVPGPNGASMQSTIPPLNAPPAVLPLPNGAVDGVK